MVDYVSVVCWLVMLPFTVVLLLLAIGAVVYYYRHGHSLDILLISFLITLILRVCTLIPVQASLTINADLKWTRTGCQFYFWWALSLQLVEVVHLICIAFDRLLIVRMPLRYHYYASTNTINVLVATMWLLGCCGSLPLMFWVTKEYSNARCHFVSTELDKGFAIFGFIMEATVCVLMVILFVDSFVFLKHTHLHRTVRLPNKKIRLSTGYQKELSTQDPRPTGNQINSPFQRGGFLRKTFINNNPKRFKQAYDTCKMGIALCFTCIITNHLPYGVMALSGLATSSLDVSLMATALLWFVMIEAIAVPAVLWFFSEKYRSSLTLVVRFITLAGPEPVYDRSELNKPEAKTCAAVIPVPRHERNGVQQNYSSPQREYNYDQPRPVDTMELGFTATFDVESITTVNTDGTETTFEDENDDLPPKYQLETPSEHEFHEEAAAPPSVVLHDEVDEPEAPEELAHFERRKSDVKDFDTKSIISNKSEIGMGEFERGVATRGSFIGSGFHTIMKARRQHVDLYDAISISSSTDKSKETPELKPKTEKVKVEGNPSSISSDKGSSDNKSVPVLVKTPPSPEAKQFEDKPDSKGDTTFKEFKNAPLDDDTKTKEKQIETETENIARENEAIEKKISKMEAEVKELRDSPDRKKFMHELSSALSGSPRTDSTAVKQDSRVHNSTPVEESTRTEDATKQSAQSQPINGSTSSENSANIPAPPPPPPPPPPLPVSTPPPEQDSEKQHDDDVRTTASQVVAEVMSGIFSNFKKKHD